MDTRILKCIQYLMITSLIIVSVGCNETNKTHSTPTQLIHTLHNESDFLDTLSIIRQAENILRQQLGEGTSICVHAIEYAYFSQDVMLPGTFLEVEYVVGTTLYRVEYTLATSELRFKEIPEYGVPCYDIDVAQIEIWPEDIVKAYPEAAIWGIELYTNTHTEQWEYPQSRDLYWWSVKAEDHDPSVFNIDVKNWDVFTRWDEP